MAAHKRTVLRVCNGSVVWCAACGLFYIVGSLPTCSSLVHYRLRQSDRRRCAAVSVTVKLVVVRIGEMKGLAMQTRFGGGVWFWVPLLIGIRWSCHDSGKVILRIMPALRVTS